MKHKNTSRRTDRRGGVAKYAAYVLSGKRFSAPEAANETKLRYSVTQFPPPFLYVSPFQLLLSVKSSHGGFCHAFVNFINQFVSKHKQQLAIAIAI